MSSSIFLYTLLILFIKNIQYIVGHNRIPPMVPNSHYDSASNDHLQLPNVPVANEGQGFAHPHVQQLHQVPQRDHGQNALHGVDMQHEKEHIMEHMEIPLDTSKMSEQELQFHYFKMHDADHNSKLDGTELINSLIHWHEQSLKTPDSESGRRPQPKLFNDEELVQLIDPILNMDDTNQDGYIDYTEFMHAQQKVDAS